MTVEELTNLTASEALNERYLAQYERESTVLHDDLVFLHTNLHLLSQLESFDAGLFEAPGAFIAYLVNELATSSAMICTRLWKDKSRKSLTLDRFAKWVVDPGIRPQYRNALRDSLAKAAFDPAVEKTIESLRDIRHSRLAHIDHLVISGLKTEPTPVALEKIHKVADGLGTYFNALTFGTQYEFVLVEFHSRESAWYEGDFGYVLDRIALGSKWFTDVDKYPDVWRVLEHSLDAEQVGRINEVRIRHGMKPLSKESSS